MAHDYEKVMITISLLLSCLFCMTNIDAYICACPHGFVIDMFQVGDLLNFLSAVFFGVHMLRTEHISRSTDKENFLPLLGYEVTIRTLC